MGIFGDQALRLLRDDWAGGAKMLAEELYAMFESTSPLKLTGPVTIENDTTTPGLTIKQLGGADNAIQISFPTIPPIDFPPLPPLDPFPNETLTNIDNTNSGGGGGGGGGGTTVFLGQVVSGTGNTYVVDLFGAGSSRAATLRVTATVPQIDPAATMPVGTWIAAVHAFSVTDPVTKVATTTYEFQPSVWV